MKPLFYLLLLSSISFIKDCDLPPTPTQGANLPADVGWASRRDLTDAQFSEWFDHYSNLGYIIKDVDAYPQGSSLRYSMIWEKNTDNRKWAEWRNLTSDGYHEKWEAYKNAGYRPTDVEGYLSNGNLRFAGIWEENKENLSWSSHRGLTSDEYGTLFEEKNAAGYRLVDMEAYETGNGVRYACIWYKNIDNLAWAQYRDMSRDKYQERIDNFSADGYRVIDFESYTLNGQPRYAAIWEKNIHNHAYQVRTDRSEVEYANLWRKYRDMGYRLIDFERYQTPSGTQYAGVWTENSPRYRWNKKNEIDDLVTDYQLDKDITGISVAIIHRGELVYQRGFGMAEADAGKEAHGRSVYLLASISKLFGGTLAAKFESEGKLADGTPVSLNVSNTTRTYLPDMGASHTHKVEEILAHIGCIWHDSTGPEPPVGHYATALSAADNIWDTAPLTNCAIGFNRNYSTHAFTFVGAVLEQVADRPIAQLIEEEIAERYGLGSIQVQYRTNSLRSNYERVAPYTDSGNETTYSDNSWKVLGGGVESDPVDLAWFGWKVLQGQIVDANTRDNRLWKRVNSNLRNGLAWELNSIGGRNVAEHGGSWTGSRTHLRVYRDPGDELVVAVLTNQGGHDPSDLATSIGNEILNP